MKARDCFVALLLAMTKIDVLLDFARRIIYCSTKPSAWRTTTFLTFAFLLLAFFPSPVFAGELSNQFAISLWVKPETSIATKALAVKDAEIRVVTDASGNPVCQIHNGTDWQTAATSTTALSLNAWANVACTYDKATIKVYVNGVQTGSTAQTATVNDTANVLRIGQDDGGTYGNFIGTVDQFQTYNYARTQKQIVSDMNAGHPAVGSPIGSAVGHWKFDEGVGITANNSGNGGSTLNGTLTSMASPATSTSGWTQSGKVGRGLVFDGTNDYITLPNVSALNITSDITISAWVRTSTTTGGPHIVGGYNASSPYAGYGFALGHAASGKLSYWSGAQAGWVGGTSTNVADGNWHHVAVVVSGTTATFYKDGLQDGTATTQLPNSYSGTRVIGARSDGAAALNGTLDEVKVYNYALTADEVKVDMNLGSSQVLGAASNNSSYALQAANQEYCVPGDSTSCAAPVGRWDFEENTGITAYDKSGNANNGTLTSGPTWAIGHKGRGAGLSFDGTDDLVSTSDASSLDVTTGLTLQGWIYLTSASSTVRMPFSKQNAYYLAVTNNSTHDLYGKIFIGSTQFGVQTTTGIPVNTWTHVAMTYDNATIRYYVNGSQVSSTAQTGSIDNSVQGFSIGDYATSTSFPWAGQIDQIRVFNYARSAAQVAWDYNRGAPVGHWKMDECQGTSIKDASGNNNHGTLTIGASGTQTAAGTCQGSANTAWKDGVTGKINYSLDFDGTDDYVEVGNTTSLNITTNMITLSAWIKPTGSFANFQGLIGKGGYDTNTGYEIVIGNSKIHFCLHTGASSCSEQASVSLLPLNQWSHIIGVYNGTTAVVYLNGVEVSSVAKSGNITSSASYSLNIGRRDQNNNSPIYFPGQIDDVRVYNYALTATQVKELYNLGAVTFKPLTGAP